MSKEEFQVLVKAMKAVWSDPKFIPDQYAFELWYAMLKDLPYEAATAALHEYILTEKYPPTVSDIRKRATKMLSEEIPDSGKAWEMARKAVHKFGYMRADEAVASLDPVTGEAVRRMGFQTMCDSSADEQGVTRAQFMRIYEQVAAHHRQDRTLPESLKQRIAKINEDALLVQNQTNLIEG